MSNQPTNKTSEPVVIESKKPDDIESVEETEETTDEASTESAEALKQIPMRLLKWGAVAMVFGMFALAQGYYLWYRAPEGFPVKSIVTIPEGTTLAQAAQLLEEENVIRSQTIFQSLVVFLEGQRGVQAGDYFFEEPLNTWEAVKRFVQVEFGLLPIKVTIPEGATTYQIAEMLEGKLDTFDAVTFMQRTEDKEGYLFPDTYLFLPNATIEEVVAAMEKNFFDKIQEIQPDIDASGRTLHEVVTMASLLEKEARTTESRKMIAGLLWNRLEVGMPLQVDAVFGYIQRRETFHPMYSDLKVESDYNTYKHKGLPPGPIANPGMRSLEAAVNPIENDYVFYLTGRDGVMRYSKTYTQHLEYKRIYLD